MKVALEELNPGKFEIAFALGKHLCMWAFSLVKSAISYKQSFSWIHINFVLLLINKNKIPWRKE